MSDHGHHVILGRLRPLCSDLFPSKERSLGQLTLDGHRPSIIAGSLTQASIAFFNVLGFNYDTFFCFSAVHTCARLEHR